VNRSSAVEYVTTYSNQIKLWQSRAFSIEFSHSFTNTHTHTHTHTHTQTYTHTHKLLSAERFRIPYMFSRHNTNVWSAVSNWTWKETSNCYALKPAYSFIYLVRITSA
jgi:hypothetical protein